MGRSAKAKRRARGRERVRARAGALPSAAAVAKAADYQLYFGPFEGHTLSQVYDKRPDYIELMARSDTKAGWMARAFLWATRDEGASR